MLATVLLVLLVLALLGGVGTAPVYPYSRAWGWGPSGLLAVFLVVLVIVMLLHRSETIIVP